MAADISVDVLIGAIWKENVGDRWVGQGSVLGWWMRLGWAVSGVTVGTNKGVEPSIAGFPRT